ncbi:hypothetical protein ACQEVC_42525 [Plantactinospora sp. CA-294935]|uniref:hypothetical protein n=1 Tax=Plantactinospora sp. CA-294935 TaxID=3240012 RepID=UPI003D946F50
MVGLPWARNPFVGERSGLTVMFGDRAPAPVTLILLGALMVVLAAVVAAMVYRRRMNLFQPEPRGAHTPRPTSPSDGPQGEVEKVQCSRGRRSWAA